MLDTTKKDKERLEIRKKIANDELRRLKNAISRLKIRQAQIKEILKDE